MCSGFITNDKHTGKWAQPYYFIKYPKMFNWSCKSKFILEVVNLCIMMFSVMYSYNKRKTWADVTTMFCEYATFGF